MTAVSFYTHVPERLSYLCRLLRKAQQSGAKVAVVGPAPLLDRLDAALWSFEPTEFVPHLRWRGAAQSGLLAVTPIVLAERAGEQPHREVLLNLGPDLPEDFEQFQRVLEVVSREPEQMQAGRQRFKTYKAMGHEVTHHEVGA
ncbi:DNA polymerase III subunit chi [Paucibacter sp. M5-1]|uniref:DNA polymerase III subunit chi n=1 Tax=Paucibacter sp. M5-1 TaxID=3015998 RepID=UPI0022B914BF|nr:DNA polymerase III subunit chi [Paucibacter sp. M5-1]MCZ7884903.1 DNA polymerase III subunit chi [Paucibacter sp. M5-1]